MTKSKEGLRFDYLEIENFKSIEKKIVEINGRSFLITGKNGKGKSSLIQALLSGIDSKVQPSNPTKTGETKASVKVKLSGIMNGVDEEYTLEVYYSPKNQKGRLVLLNKNMETVGSPKEVLKSIIGNVTFDIYKFLNDTKANKIKILKELSGVRVPIDLLDIERKKIYDDRTFLTRTVTEKEAVMNNHGMTLEEIDLYSDKLPIEPIQEELDGISKKIEDWNRINTGTQESIKFIEVTIPADIRKAKDTANDKQRKINEINEEAKRKIKELSDEIALINEGIDELIKQTSGIKDKIKKGGEWLLKNTQPQATEISKRLSDALLHNENHNKVLALAEKQKELIKDKTTLQKYNSDIEKIDDKKDKLMKNSKLPIPDLKFDDEEIYINGLPLESEQINSAKLIEIGVEISMALNPNLRTIFLHEGSLFDKDALNALIAKVEERGYQLIAEIVSEENDLSINFIESEV